MEEKVPWWRWLVALALGRIRSGLETFRRNGKADSGMGNSIAIAHAEPEIRSTECNGESSKAVTPNELTNDETDSSATGVTESEESGTGIREPGTEAGEDGAAIEPQAELSGRDAQTDREALGEEIALTKTSPQSEASAQEVKPVSQAPNSESTHRGPAAETPSAQGAVTLQAAGDNKIREIGIAPLPESGVAPAVEAAAVRQTESAPETAPTKLVDPTPQPASAAPREAKPTVEPTTAEKVAAALKARGADAEQSPFSVIVSQVYDGPLDLLLDLIRKQDIDIYDIPIAKITAQFLAYVDRLRAGDMDVAGEFIYTAALLIHIKSRMLLPRAPAGPEEQAEDPRRELVERLLEHERFKNAAQMLREKQMLEAATWTNPGVREFHENAEAEPEIAADTTDLMRVFRDVLERARNRPILDLEEDSVTVSQMIQFLSRRLNMEDKPIALRRMLSHTRSERALIAMFLALLELVRLQAILLRQDRQFSEIFIKKSAGFEAVMNQGFADAQDDWR